jgi:predicted TIM-barrel fold metal-dependent hydrolase
MADPTREPWSLFGPDEIAEIESGAIPFGSDRTVDALQFAAGWAARVAKLDADRSLDWTDHTVWNEHDLAGSLHQRDFLQRALDELPAPLRERLAAWVSRADDRFRAYTVEDPDRKMAKIAEIDLDGRPWWWRRVPADGPIVRDLQNY